MSKARKSICVGKAHLGSGEEQFSLQACPLVLTQVEAHSPLLSRTADVSGAEGP